MNTVSHQFQALHITAPSDHSKNVSSQHKPPHSPHHSKHKSPTDICSPTPEQVKQCSAAGILLFTNEQTPTKNTIKFLLGMGSPYSPGWHHCGGKIEPEKDATIEECALREFQEETYHCLNEDQIAMVRQQLNLRNSFYLTLCKQVIFLAYLKDMPSMDRFRQLMNEDTSEWKEMVDFKLDELTDGNGGDMRNFFGEFVKKNRWDLGKMARSVMQWVTPVPTATPHFKKKCPQKIVKKVAKEETHAMNTPTIIDLDVPQSLNTQ